MPLDGVVPVASLEPDPFLSPVESLSPGGRYVHQRGTDADRTALEQHYLLNDRYPDDFTKFLEENFRSKLKKVTLDSWGTPYRFARQGERYVIRSAGPDRAFDNADDVFLLHETRPVSSGQSGLDWVLV
jgi:hypothetical protein